MRLPPFLLLFCCSVAAADPLNVGIRGQTAAPERPQITVRAQEPVTDLSLTVVPEPAQPAAGAPAGAPPQEDPVRFASPALRPGRPVTLNLGSGKPGKVRWAGGIDYKARGRAWHFDLRFETLVSPGALRIVYDKGHLNLEKRYVEVQFSQPAALAELTVLGEDGQEMGRGTVHFHGEPPGTWLRVPWEETRPGTVLELDLKLYDRAGFAGHVQLYPWSVAVPHQEVLFATDSYEIRPAEQPKLDESVQRIAGILEKVKGRARPRLYIDGHTDTVAGDAYNLELSRNRARAIAAYLRGHGVAVPISYAGSGKRAPRVPTADNVDEPRNRRVDYVLSIDPPRLPPGVSWQKLD